MGSNDEMLLLIFKCNPQFIQHKPKDQNRVTDTGSHEKGCQGLLVNLGVVSNHLKKKEGATNLTSESTMHPII